MLEPGGGADLAQESLGAEARAEVGMQDLEGDGPVVPEVAGEVDGGHAAAAELALEGVPPAQRVLQTLARPEGGNRPVHG